LISVIRKGWQKRFLKVLKNLKIDMIGCDFSLIKKAEISNFGFFNFTIL